MEVSLLWFYIAMPLLLLVVLGVSIVQNSNLKKEIRESRGETVQFIQSKMTDVSMPKSKNWSTFAPLWSIV